MEPRKKVILVGGTQKERSLWRLRMDLWRYTAIEAVEMETIVELFARREEAVVIVALSCASVELFANQLSLLRCTEFREVMRILLVGPVLQGTAVWWDQQVRDGSPAEVRRTLKTMHTRKRGPKAATMA